METRLERIQQPEIRNIIKDMVTLSPESRTGCMKGLEYFRGFYGKEYFDILLHLNYSLRRPEFSHPDIKLGLIRLLSPFIIKAFRGMVEDESLK